MKIELEQSDIEAIAGKVTEQIRPLLSGQGRIRDEEKIFTTETLAEYFQVDKTWVYKRVWNKEIPYFKHGKFTRFKKSEIDRWWTENSVKPVPFNSKVFKRNRPGSRMEVKTEEIRGGPHE